MKRGALRPVLAAALCTASHGAQAKVAPPAPAGSAPEAVVQYQVKPGDTLYDLARRNFLHLRDYRSVQRANHIRDPRRLASGRDLTIPAGLLRTEAVGAVAETVSGQAFVTAEGRKSALAKGSALHEGDVITTSANSFVRITLPDASHVTLPSQSQIRIQTLRYTPLTGAVDRAFVLDAGRGEAVVTPMKRPSDRFIIKTPLSIAAVRGTDFRVAFDPESQSGAVEVIEGTVGVTSTTDDTAAVVHKAFGTRSSANGVAAPTPLLDPPTLTDPGKIRQEGQVVLDLAPEPGAVAYRAELAPDAGLIEPIAEVRSDQPRFTFPALADGDWFVRLTAIGPDGLEGLPRTYGFERILNDLSLAAPIRSQMHRKTHWLFQWTPEGEGIRAFRFQLSRKIDGAAPLIDEAGLDRPQITVTSLPDGVYYWRVRSSLIRNGRTYEKWSQPQEFRIGS